MKNSNFMASQRSISSNLSSLILLLTDISIIQLNENKHLMTKNSQIFPKNIGNVFHN